MHAALAHPPRERLHGLDAVRVIALLFGVVVHASIAWIPGAQYVWVVHDGSPSEVAGLLFYVPHMFRMLLFFLIAGLFARMACERLGTIGFVRDRVRRIAIPLASLWFPMLMAIVAASAAGRPIAACAANAAAVAAQCPADPSVVPVRVAALLHRRARAARNARSQCVAATRE